MKWFQLVFMKELHKIGRQGITIPQMSKLHVTFKFLPDLSCKTTIQKQVKICFFRALTKITNTQTMFSLPLQSVPC
jgi:hypothetical protein